MAVKERINILTFTDNPDVEYQINDATGENSFAYGTNLSVTGDNQVVFGKNNRDDKDLVFAIGNGKNSGEDGRKNILEVYKDGRALLNDKPLFTGGGEGTEVQTTASAIDLEEPINFTAKLDSDFTQTGEFDGTIKNVTVPVTGILPTTKGGTGTNLENDVDKTQFRTKIEAPKLSTLDYGEGRLLYPDGSPIKRLLPGTYQDSKGNSYRTSLGRGNGEDNLGPSWYTNIYVDNVYTSLVNAGNAIKTNTVEADTVKAKELTTETPISVENGGTGANSEKDVRKNLSVPMIKKVGDAYVLYTPEEAQIDPMQFGKIIPTQYANKNWSALGDSNHKWSEIHDGKIYTDYIVLTGEKSYGSSLPASGVQGQLFFKTI